MPLKGQDILTCIQLCLVPTREWTYPELAQRLSLSSSEAHAAVARSLAAGLLFRNAEHADRPEPRRANLFEFLQSGVRVAFFVAPGPIGRGVPTGRSAPPLDALIHSPPNDPPLVWSHPEGEARGRTIEPLYKSVPDIARRDPSMHEVLALVDAVRCGAARERQLAREELRARLIDDERA